MDNTNHTHLQPPLSGPRKRASSEALDGSPVLKSPRLAPKDDDGRIEVDYEPCDKIVKWENPKISDQNRGMQKGAVILRERIKIQQRIRKEDGKEWCCQCKRHVQRTNHPKCRQCSHYPCIECLARRTEDEKDNSEAITTVSKV
ncbi:hypothetical protein AUP68_05466 [Ilyonectria robusta]